MPSLQEHFSIIRVAACGIAVVFLALLLQPVANSQSNAEITRSVDSCRRVQELSARLACYDRAFPPLIESGDDNAPSEPGGAARVVAPAANSIEPAQPPAARVVEPESLPAMARIVAVEKPSLRTTRFHASDGRVYVQSNATRLYRWPEPPFDVEIDIGKFGTTFLVFPDTDLRIRVASGD
jgi:hypothetical protein